MRKKIKLGTPKTVGELKEIINKYADEIEIETENMPRISIYGYYDYFQNIPILVFK